MVRSRLSSLCLAPLILAAPLEYLHAQGAPIGFAETYALAADRAQAIATLTPGSDDWYWYSCRERLDAGDFARVRALLPAWVERHGRSQRVVEIENREALLSFPADPERTFSFLRDRLGLQWNHQRVVPGERSDLPTRLDPQAITAATLTARALAQHPGTVDGFTDRALAALAATELRDDQLQSLLARLARPDVANLPALVVRDLALKNSRGFGSRPIHAELRLEQLEECVRLRPALLAEANFVNAWLTRLTPGADRDWRADPAARAAQFARLWAFAQRLPAAHNSLKAHVLHHWLQHDLTQGAPDREHFLAYLRLPRRSGNPAEGHLRRFTRNDEFVNNGGRYPTELPAIGDDTALVRACLEHFFVREDGIEAYSELLDADWLRGVLAETKLLLGQGDLERWTALLNDPRRLEALERRVEIEFPPTQRTLFAADDAVQLAVDVKNVPTLLVKVFAIDSYRFHVERQREVDATIDLDGVVPNFEQTATSNEPPLRRVRRTFDLPMLKAPGTYVVELVGNGISSRAVIHKGGLRQVERTAAAGQLFRVYDEAGLHLRDAVLWFGGREYAADENGEFLLPFSTEPGDKTLVLRHGNRSTLARFDHRAESYQLHAGLLVDREALVAGQIARLLVRPQLRLADRAVSLALLSEPVLTLIATDQDGLATPQEVRGLALADEREFVHEFRVPERLVRLQASLRGSVRDLAGEPVVLQTPTRTFEVNGIDATAQTGGAMLLPTPGGYVLELRGKNGEPKAGQPCQLALFHRDYREPVAATLQTDATGRIELGPLPGIDSVGVQLPSGFAGSFPLPRARCTLPTLLHGRAGEVLRLPYQGQATTASRAEFALLGQERDEFSRLALADGFLELRDLAPGDYDLRLHQLDQRITVRVTAGERDGGWLLGRERLLQASSRQPLHLRAIEADAGALTIRLAHATAATRVHVVASRFLPADDPYALLRGVASEPPRSGDGTLPVSSYHAGRTLGDEYRYVLERRFQTKYAGNMLRRPTLLLNPWAIDDESANEAIGIGGGGGGAFGGRGGGRSRKSAGGGLSGNPGAGGPHPATFANLDWLPRGSVTLANLEPDRDGTVRVPRSELGDGQFVQVLAIDGDEALYDRLVLAERPLEPRPRQLRVALDGQRHFIEQRRIEFLAAGATAVLGDARSARVEIYDSLASVHRLLMAVSQDATLAKFAFLLDWPNLPTERKRELYSQHACHELHFFLARKDPEFFAAIVRPFLANKGERTFLDRYLLGDDLRAFAEPWAFAQLNLIEQILLAQRLGDDERAAIARRVREQLELRPPNRERSDRLFDLALKSDELAKTKPRAGRAGEEFADQGDFKGPGDAMPPVGDPGAPGAPARMPAERAATKDARAAAEKKNADAEDVLESEELKKLEDSGRDKQDSLRALNEELTRRGEVRALYRAVEPTKLWAEHDYWRRRREETTPDVVAPSRFWADYAAAPAGQPFVSAAIIETGGSFLEMMFALAVLDLPFTAGKHEVTTDGERRTLRAATPLLLVRKEVQPAELSKELPPLLLGENFFRLDDRYRFDGEQRRDAFITGEFLVGVAYGCQVIVTNPTSSPRTAELLLQIPAGALPVQGGFWTKGIAVELAPYATASIEYAFYFPAAGDFAHFPAHAGERGLLAAAAAPQTLRVVATATTVDTGSWEHVSQQGSPAELLAFLDRHNLERLDLQKIAWRMRDRAQFSAVLERLRARHAWDDTLWSYALLHRDVAAAREYLSHATGFVQQCGMVLTAPLLTIDPVARGSWQQLELEPLVHARAHRLGGARLIGNADLARQYGALLARLSYQPRLGSRDWLAVTYYLLLQDRIEEGIAAFAKVAPAELHERLQYDYLDAYLCFFTGDAARARTIAERHRADPVPHWQKRFAEVLRQLDEAEGKAAPLGPEAGADALAATTPSLELALTGQELTLRYRNLAACEVRYYELDVEFAFSAQPFAESGGAAAAFVQPSLQENRTLPAGQTELAFELPARFARKNMLIEVRGGGLVRAQTWFSNALAVRFVESFGQLVVAEPGSDRPLPKSYVKVFAKLPDGRVRFHKDGYTDLRGRFDYASLSDDPNAGAVRYAVLVLHDQRGAVIREVAPPTR